MTLSASTQSRLAEALCDNDSAQQIVNMIGVGGAVFSTGTDATHLGFFGVTVTTRASAITQTYATASRTHANQTYAALTDSTGGVAATTFAAITAPAANAVTSLTADMTAVKNALAQIVVSLTALNADVANVKQVLNAVIDDLQAYGLES